MPGGRPTDYNPEIAKRICDLVATHPYGLKKLHEMYDWMPAVQTIKDWRRAHSEFLSQYLEAKELQGVEITEDLWAQADNLTSKEECDIFDRKFRFHQWHLSKLAPKQFGDKKEIKQEMNLNVHESDLAHLK